MCRQIKYWWTHSPQLTVDVWWCKNEFCKREHFCPACFWAHPDIMCPSKHTEKHTELVLLGRPSDWCALRQEAGLGAVGVSQNQTPRSSSLHSLRICRVDLIDTHWFFLFGSESTDLFSFRPAACVKRRVEPAATRCADQVNFFSFCCGRPIWVVSSARLHSAPPPWIWFGLWASLGSSAPGLPQQSDTASTGTAPTQSNYILPWICL